MAPTPTANPTDDPTANPTDDPTADTALAPDDARVLDLLVDVGFDLERLAHHAPTLSDDDRRRAERLVAQCALIDLYPDAGDADDRGVDADTLVAATLARIDQAERERESRMRLDPARDVRGRRGFRIGDLIAVASIAILATTTVVPLLNWRNAEALDTKCANNMRRIAQGMHAYTIDNQAMPMAASLVPLPTSWLGYRNANNLNVLAAAKYCEGGCLCCPGDVEPNPTYAYQVPTSGDRPLWNIGPRTVVVGDRNPLVDLKRHGETVGSVALNSASHGGRGQNLLFSDGSVVFDDSPYLEQTSDGLRKRTGGPGAVEDNIWLPFGDRADLLATPAIRRGSLDAFLLH
jgi:hypothetical protein